MDELEKDRQLLKNLDLILKGQETDVKETADNDLRSALSFTRKMASLREKPSAEFRTNLKAQLIHQFAEQEKKARSRRQSFLFWEMPRSTRWYWTITALLALTIAAIIWLITYLLNRVG